MGLKSLREFRQPRQSGILSEMTRRPCDLESNAGSATSGNMTRPLRVSKAVWHQEDLREALALEAKIKEHAKQSNKTRTDQGE